MLDEMLLQHEGKTLEFKENANSPLNIMKTVIAFANTAGGIIVIGVQDKTKKVLGVAQVLQEEERLSNMVFDLISPLLVPDLNIVNYEGKELLLIQVPYLIGPFYLKNAGLSKGTYIRLGSSNRLADPETLVNLQRLSQRLSFDELPCISADVKELDKALIQEKLGAGFKQLSEKHYESLGLLASHHKKVYATYGALLLFGLDKKKYLPDSIIKCVCFASPVMKHIIDKREINVNLIQAVDEVMHFIRRNTRISSEIHAIRRVDTPEYPLDALREAVINALIHADYSVKGASIQISIFSDRIEIIDPGSLPFGQTLHSALSGISKMRNPIIGRIFRELGLIETLGSGIPNIIQAYAHSSAAAPKFEEIDHFFKVTLYSRPITLWSHEVWFKQLQEIFVTHTNITTNEIAQIWGVSDRTARLRLNKLLKMGYIQRQARSNTDPATTYSKIS